MASSEQDRTAYLEVVAMIRVSLGDGGEAAWRALCPTDTRQLGLQFLALRNLTVDLVRFIERRAGVSPFELLNAITQIVVEDDDITRRRHKTALDTLPPLDDERTDNERHAAT